VAALRRWCAAQAIVNERIAELLFEQRRARRKDDS
jgi:hypothetical protein